MENKRVKKTAKVLALVLAAALIITSFSFVAFLPGLLGAEGFTVYGAEQTGAKTGGQANSQAYLNSELLVLKTMIEQIRANYKDDVSYETLMKGAFSGTLEALGDPYSVYYKTTEESESFLENASGEFSGIGVSIELYGNYCRIVSPMPNTPAERAGLRTGDLIRKVDGAEMKGKSAAEVSALLKGPAGTKVSLTLDRGGQSVQAELTREKIQEITVSGRMLDDQIGYIQISQFGTSTDREFREMRLKLLNQGMKGLVIDIRGNSGGVMETAIGVASQLIAEPGPLLHFAQKGVVLDTAMGKGSKEKQVPTVLLVNEGSASASEALAGALKDTKAATLVGTTTFGKGIAQQVAELPDGTSYKLSMFYFLTPDKNTIDKTGIAPDHAVYNGMGLTAGQKAELYADLAPMAENVKYKAGETGLNVYAAQQRLQYMGYDLAVTGTMDAMTVAAVKRFQTEQGFTAYGGLDFTTMRALEQAFSTLVNDGAEDRQLQKAIELLTAK